MDAMVEIRTIFFEESAEGLAALDATLPAFAAGTLDEETIGTAYRAVHSIKGGAASFRLNELSAFAKTFEALLGQVRSGALAPDPDVADLVSRCAAALAVQVEASRQTAALCDEIAAHLPQEEAAAPADADPGEEIDFADLGFTPVAIDAGDIFGADGSADPIGPTRYDIVFRPFPSLYASANEAALLIRDVLRLGQGTVTCLCDDLPELGALDPEAAALAFRIELETTEGEDTILDVFSFVDTDCELDITRRDPAPTEQGEDILARLLEAARA